MYLAKRLHTGFESLPELYGSAPRHPPAKVDDFQSGVKAAGKGLFHGYYDAITGLVTEPIEGGQKEVSRLCLGVWICSGLTSFVHRVSLA
jgi:sterol 3beta-glucosyltransferase